MYKKLISCFSMGFDAFAKDRNEAVAVNCAAAINRRNGLSLLAIAITTTTTTARMNCSSLTVANSTGYMLTEVKDIH